jgi:hypothetical protein
MQATFIAIHAAATAVRRVVSIRNVSIIARTHQKLQQFPLLDMEEVHQQEGQQYWVVKAQISRPGGFQFEPKQRLGLHLKTQTNAPHHTWVGHVVPRSTASKCAGARIERSDILVGVVGRDIRGLAIEQVVQLLLLPEIPIVLLRQRRKRRGGSGSGAELNPPRESQRPGGSPAKSRGSPARRGQGRR